MLDSSARRVSMKSPILTTGIFAFCLTAWVSVNSSGAQEAAPKKIVEYKERVAMTTGEIRKGEICATFYPELESGEFFNGVQRIDNEGVLEFRRYSRMVTAYPPHLTIQISIRASVCDADIFTPAPNPEFLKTLHFKVQWKRQLYLRPVESYTIQTVPLTLDESESRELVVVQIYDSGNVPLTDHLILTALSPEGKILSRMAAHL